MCEGAPEGQADNPSTPNGRPGGFHSGKGAGGFATKTDAEKANNFEKEINIGPGTLLGALSPIPGGVAIGMALDKAFNNNPVATFSTNTSQQAAARRANEGRVSDDGANAARGGTGNSRDVGTAKLARAVKAPAASSATSTSSTASTSRRLPVPVLGVRNPNILGPRPNQLF